MAAARDGRKLEIAFPLQLRQRGSEFERSEQTGSDGIHVMVPFRSSPQDSHVPRDFGSHHALVVSVDVLIAGGGVDVFCSAIYFNPRPLLEGGGCRRGRAASRRASYLLVGVLGFVSVRLPSQLVPGLSHSSVKVTACFTFSPQSSFPLRRVPMPSDNGDNVYNIVPYHRPTLPKQKLLVCQECHGETHSNDKEANVARVCLSIHSEFAYQRHGAGDDTCDEAGRPDELAHGHAGAIGAHGGKGAEDIRRPIAKGEKCDAGQALAQAEDRGDGTEIDAEEIAGGDANRGEE